MSGSLLKMFDHVRGLGSVLLHRSLQLGSTSEDWHDFADEYRLFEAVFCLIYRKASVLTGTDLCRNGRPRTPAGSQWSLKRSETSQVSGLICIVRRIPPVMCYIDDLKAGKSSVNPSADTREAIDSLLYVLMELERWSADFLRQSASTVLESDAYVHGYEDLEFPNFEVASAWNFWLSFKAHALESYVSLLEMTGSSHQDCETSELCNLADGSSGSYCDTACKDIMDACVGLLATVQLLIRSMPSLLEANVGYVGRSFVAFPLETVRLVLLREVERNPGLFLTTTLQSTGESPDERSQIILEGLACCAKIAEKAKTMRCALFTDHSSGDLSEG